MGEVIELPLDGGRHALVIEETTGIHWYACSFIDREGAHTLPLGAESRGYLIARLRSVLEGSEEADGTIVGHAVRWILSLAEQHVTFYLSTGDSAEDRTLFLQDANGQVVRKAELRREDIAEWRARLESFPSTLPARTEH